MIEPIQSVTLPVEKLALEIANAIDRDEAGGAALFKSKCKEHSLTYGEASAMAHIIGCMRAGRRWKKGN